MNKSILISILLASVAGSAIAAPAPTSGSPAIAQGQPLAVGLVGTTAAAAPAAPTVGGTLVNPFNGKPLSMEMLQRELETSRYQSQLLEEQIKQTAAQAELVNIPIRKSVENAQARTQARKEEAAMFDIDNQIAASKAAGVAAAQAARAAQPPAAPKVIKKSAKVLAKEKLEEAEAARVAAVAAEAAAVARANFVPRATLLSVISVGSSRSVVLEIAGNITTVADGGTSPSGKVKILNGDSATVGAHTLKVHDQTLGRFVVSDPKPVEPGKGGGPVMTASASSSPMPAQSTALPPGIPVANGVLPPPPIPSGSFKPFTAPIR